MLVVLMNQLIGVLLHNSIIKLGLVLGVNHLLVSLDLVPLVLRTELLHRREHPRFVRYEVCSVFVVAEFDFEVQLALIRQAQVLPRVDQVLKLRAVTSIVKVDNSWSVVALP